MNRERLFVLGRHPLSCSLPPCGGGLGRGVAASSVFVAYPPPERFAFDLPHKGGGNKNECPS
jgi:hypothetical protein